MNYSKTMKIFAICAIFAMAHTALAGESVSEKSVADTVVYLDNLDVLSVKQSDRLHDEPVSASYIGMTELEQLNADAIKNISDVVPNLYIPEYGSRITSTIYVRGIGARMDQPSVGLNVDNVPFLNKNAYDFDMADIASVEVLRGPQSTLYGRNTIGGLINISTLSPLRWQGWRFSLTGASGNEWKVSAGWYGKISSDFATAITGSFSYLGGFYRNVYNGKKVDKERSGALRWKFDGHLSEKLTMRNTLSASILRQGGYPYEYIETGEINHNDTCFYHRSLINDGLTLSYRSAGYTMTSITSIQYLDDNITLDQDFLPLPYFTLTQKQRELGVTEDLVFKGCVSDGRYNWVAGFFGFIKNIDMDAPVTFGDQGIASLIEAHRNQANPDYPIRWDSREFTLGSNFCMPTGGLALYHESTFCIDSWKLSAGIRVDWEQARLRYHSHCDTGYEVFKLHDDDSLTPYRHIDIDIDDRDRLKRNFFNWSPKLTALYQLPMPGENNIYCSFSRGYKAGGYNTQMFSDVLQQRLMGVMGIGAKYDVDDVVGYKPEYSWNAEIGTHFSFPDARLNLDLSVFYITCRDQQLTMFPSGTTTGRIMTNAGRTRSCGGELSVVWKPFSNLEFTASYGYTDARFKDFFNGIENFRGKFVPYAPKNTIFGQAVYALMFDGWVKSLSFEANVRATGKIYWNESNTLSQPMYALLGASLTLQSERFSLQIWGRNLTDTPYNTFYFLSMGNEFLQRGRPIQIGATLRFDIR